MGKLKEKFIQQALQTNDPQLLVTAVRLPSGALEVITNTQEVESKIAYLDNAYDDDFKLKNNPAIKIEGYLLV